MRILFLKENFTVCVYTASIDIFPPNNEKTCYLSLEKNVKCLKTFAVPGNVCHLICLQNNKKHNEKESLNTAILSSNKNIEFIPATIDFI